MWPFKRKPSRQKRIVMLLLFIFVCQLAGAVGSLFTSPAIGTWYATINKPCFTPPNWLFAPVWVTLFTLIGISAFLVWEKGGDSERSKAMAIFVIQLILNALWSIFFFGLRAPGAAFAEIIVLWIVIAIMMVKFNRVDTRAAWLLTPYIFWVTVAAALNYGIWILN